MTENVRPEIEDVDALLASQAYLWSALHEHGRERRLEASLLAEINDLLDLRNNIMEGREEI